MRILVFVIACALTSTGGADDAWMFPLKIEIPTTQVEMDSLMMREMYAELHGTRYAENTSREVHTSVASFEDIVKWYAERLVVPDLPKKLAAFNKRVVAEPEHRAEHLSRPDDDPTKAQPLVTSWFTSNQKQVTTLFPDENGDVIAISILGMEEKTRILVMRRRTQQTGR